MRLILYLAVAFIIWRIVRSFASSASSHQPTVGGPPPREERLDPQRRVDIDYTKVRDADFRDARDDDRRD
jgi:hypothetical protein